MKKYPIIFDIETKHTFREMEKHKNLGVSVVGLYDYATESYHCFREHELTKLFPYFENASYLIGFNINGFDLPVLAAHYPGDVSQFATFDICDDVRDRLGRRLALNDLGHATLGVKKSGNGLQAIEYFREGKWDELTNYCLDDVKLTKNLFDFGMENEYIHYLSHTGKEKLVVQWKKYLDDSNHRDLELTLPF